MKRFQPAPSEKFTLRDLGVLRETRCEHLDRITDWGERLIPRVGCLAFIKDEESRRVIRRSVGPIANRHSARTRYLLEESLTARVCDEARVIGDADTMSWSPTMPEIEDYKAHSFLAAPIEGPAGDMVGMIAAFSTIAGFVKPEVATDLKGLATQISHRILLVAAMATLQRVAKGEEPFAVPIPLGQKH